MNALIDQRAGEGIGTAAKGEESVSEAVATAENHAMPNTLPEIVPQEEVTLPEEAIEARSKASTLETEVAA